MRHVSLDFEGQAMDGDVSVTAACFLLFLWYSWFMFDENFDRITQNPAIMRGKPCIRGMRVTVGMIVGQIGAGVSSEEILSDYPYLEKEDIMQALQYAAQQFSVSTLLAQ